MAALFRDTAWYIAQDPHYTLWRYNIREHTGGNRKITASNYLLSCGVSQKPIDARHNEEDRINDIDWTR